MSEDGKAKRKKIIEKIRALLAMTADRGAAEAETLKAAEQVSKLMEEHDLSYDDVNTELADEKYGMRTKEFPTDAMGNIHEVMQCSHAIAEYFDCKSWLDRNKEGVVQLVYFGTADDTAMAHDMTSMLKTTSETSYRDFLRSDDADPRVSARHLRNGFMIGFGRRISERLRELKNLRTYGSTRGSALVLVKDKIVAEKLEATGLEFTVRAPSIVPVADTALEAGYKAGDKVAINAAIEAPKPQ
jgi:hypothetical protein